jgi:hypothetical protein
VLPDRQIGLEQTESRGDLSVRAEEVQEANELQLIVRAGIDPQIDRIVTVAELDQAKTLCVFQGPFWRIVQPVRPTLSFFACPKEYRQLGI